MLVVLRVKMKRNWIIVAAIAGCLTGCATSRLSRDITGQWQVTHFDAYGTPMPNVVLIAEFRPDGTWQSEARAASETNRYVGTYAVSGNELALHVPWEEGCVKDSGRFTYCNGMLISVAPTHKSIAIKMGTQNQALHGTADSRADAPASVP